MLLITLFVMSSCNSDKNNNQLSKQTVTSVIEAKEIQLPSDISIINTIKEQGIEIVGKVRTSENEFNIYYSHYGDVSWTHFVLIHLDNGLWLLNSPGYYSRIVTLNDSKNIKNSNSSSSVVAVDTVIVK